MSNEQIVTIVVGVAQSGAIWWIVSALLKGLRTEVRSLNNTITAQEKTLDTMEKRIAQTEGITAVYQNFFSNIPKDLENYKLILESIKDAQITALKDEAERKEAVITELKNLQGQEINNHSDQRARKMSILTQLASNNHEQLLKFVQRLCGDPGLAAELITAAQDLPKLITQAGWSLQIENDQQAFHALVKNNNYSHTAQIMDTSWSHYNWFALLSTKVVIINQPLVDQFSYEIAQIRGIALS